MKLNELEISISLHKQVEDLVLFIKDNSKNKEAHEMEKKLFHKIIEIGKIAMRGYFEERANEQENPPTIVLSNGECYKKNGEQSVTYFSIFGKIKVNRKVYFAYKRGCIYPLDRDCNLPENSYSYFLQKIIASLSLTGSFKDSENKMKDFFNLDIHDGQIEKYSQKNSDYYDEFEKERTLPEPETEGEIIVGSFDGKGVPMIKKEAAKIVSRLGKGEKLQKKKEALVGVCYSVDKKTRTAQEVATNLIFPELKKDVRKTTNSKNKENLENTKENHPVKAKNIHRTASLVKAKKEVIEQIQKESIARNPGNKKEHVVLVDGSLYLIKLIVNTLTLLYRYTLILDIIHVLEYLYVAANTLHGEKTKESRDYVYDLLLQILQGNVKSVISQLKKHKKGKENTKAKIKALDKVITYFSNHKHMMQYDKYLAKGYPIGTGIVESSCKLLVNDRMEGSGMRWSIKGAEAMLKLRSLEKSNEFEEYYKYYINKEKEKLYTNRWIKQAA